jgi:hypothetical protein
LTEKDRRFMRIRRFFRFYVAVPTLLAYLLVFAISYRPTARLFFKGANWLTTTVNTPTWVDAFLGELVVNAIVTVILGTGLYLILRQKKLQDMTGDFRAFDLTNGSKEEWGTVKLRYELGVGGLTGVGHRMRLELRHDDVILQGDGIVLQDQHYVGFYSETSRPARRRFGAFFMTLGGDGQSYEGNFVFLDPKTGSPTIGNARWEI